MSIRPVDFQVSIPRSNDVAKNNNTSTKGDEARQVFTQEMQKQVEIEQTQVQSANKSEYNLVDKDGKNNSHKDSEKKDKKDDKDKNGGKKEAKIGLSRYDISI